MTRIPQQKLQWWTKATQNVKEENRHNQEKQKQGKKIVHSVLNTFTVFKQYNVKVIFVCMCVLNR